MVRKWRFLFLTAGLITGPGCQTAAMAFSAPDWLEPRLDIGFELFSWQETDDQGVRLLTEEGPRIFISLAQNNLNRGSGSGFIYDVNLKGYRGRVDYDGQTQSTSPSLSGVFLATRTAYLGGSAELAAGYRFGGIMFGHDLDVQGVAGIDAWEREIRAGLNAKGVLVAGSTEDYRIYYARLGAGLPHTLGNLKGYLQAGVKRPFSTSEDVDFFNVTLSPGKDPSAYVRYTLSLQPQGSPRRIKAHADFYYDSFRFSKSAVENSVLQPDSKLDTLGIALGVSF